MKISKYKNIIIVVLLLLNSTQRRSYYFVTFTHSSVFVKATVLQVLLLAVMTNVRLIVLIKEDTTFMI
jgi:hypothetical protein